MQLIPLLSQIGDGICNHSLWHVMTQQNSKTVKHVCVQRNGLQHMCPETGSHEHLAAPILQKCIEHDLVRNWTLWLCAIFGGLGPGVPGGMQ